MLRQRVLRQPFSMPRWRPQYTWALAAIILVVAVAVFAVALRSSGPETQTDTVSTLTSNFEQPPVIPGEVSLTNGSEANGSQVVEPQARSNSLSSAASAPQANDGNGAITPASAEVPKVSQTRIPWAIKNRPIVLSSAGFFRGSVGNPDVSNPEVFARLNEEGCRCRGHLNGVDYLREFLLAAYYSGPDVPIPDSAEKASRFVENPSLVKSTQEFLYSAFPAPHSQYLSLGFGRHGLHIPVEPGKTVTFPFSLRDYFVTVKGTATMAWRSEILQWKILDITYEK